MNVSTFTKKTKHEIVAFLILIAFLLLYSRKPVLIAVALIPIAIASLLIMRTSILRRFARTPIRQVAFVDLLEPIVEYRQSAPGRSRPEIVRYGKREIPIVKRIDHCYANFDEYIARKGNPSVMVCGRSGMGKSELMNVLLLSAKEPKIVFSFKPNDAYLRMPCQVIDVSRNIPDPFQDADAFSIAYALAFPANVRGITFSQVRAIVKSVARESKNWSEFKDNLKRTGRKATDIQKEALALIEAQIEGLVVGEGSFSVDLVKDTVLDFSYLDESAKTFYAEIALRQIWSSLPDVATWLDASLTNGNPLPPWLHFDPVTGRFYGTPPAGFTGSFSVQVDAINADGKAVELILNITIGSPSADAGGRAGMAAALLQVPADNGFAGAAAPLEKGIWRVLDGDGVTADRHAEMPGFAASHARAGPLGKTALTDQLKAAGWHGLLLERSALLDSLREQRAML